MSRIIIADVHGRTFWKDAVKDRENEKIIFLGDYLDPYRDEFPGRDVFDIKTDAINNFKEIIEFKKTHMDNVVLLIGNHDAEYMISTDICNCRMDYERYKEIQALFKDNKKLFQLVFEENGVIYSHGGIRKAWVHSFAPDIEEKTLVDYLNNKFELMMSVPFPEEMEFVQELAACSFYRGGWSDFSSCIWGDIREWINRNNSRPYSAYQVFGHTRLNGEPVVTKDWACLDCSRGFIMNDENVITELDGSEVKIFKNLNGDEDDTED